MRAKPILTFSLVAGALALPGAASALGLGKLTVNSALGEPLSAQIELTSASREELDSLSARIADPSIYRQNNLTYQPVLTRARVSVDRLPDGTAVLRVSSPVSVAEPYLDLLVDVNWASGRVLREYTFLLDPPGAAATQQTAEPVQPARGAQTQAAQVPSVPRATAPREARPAAAPPADGYQVKRGDTLSGIAQTYKPATVSLDQMLVALYNANAAAFEGNNMNRLRSGAIMTIPGPEQAAATPPADATRQVKVQASDWRSYRDRVAAGAPVVEGSEARQAAGGRISTAVEDKAAPARPSSDQLRVSREAGTGKAAPTAAAEDSAARDKAMREANARIAELEKTLKEMQRALELRSQTMAQAQQQADAAKAKAAPVAPPPAPITVAKAPEAPKAVEPAKAPEPPKAAEAPKPAEPSKAQPVAKAPEPPKAEPVAKAAEPPKAEPVAKAPEPPKAAEPAKAPEPPKVAEPAKAPEPPKAAEPPKAVPVAKPAPKAAPKAEPSFFDDFLPDVPGWAMGVGGLAILGGIAALVAARRRKTTKFEDSIISGTDIKTNTVFGSTGGGVVNTGDNSLASDFSREGLGNIDTDEVDPIAEAEVYLAYGRDAQAEEILKDALKKDPQRQEIYLKLLEIHAQHNKPSAFETVASELYAVTNGQGEVWHKAVALGRQLDPNNPMFGETGQRPAEVAAPPPAAAAQPVHAPAKPAPVAATPAGTPLDAQLDEEISISPTSGPAPKTPADILAGAERALEESERHAGSVAEEAAERAHAAAAGATAALAGTLAAGKLAVDTTMRGLGETVDTTVSHQEPAPSYDLEFRLDDADRPAPMGKPRGEPALAEAAPALARPAAALELDKLDLSFDPDRSTFEDPTPSVLDGQWHDAATKLDLAKAYQEMGDVEGAREILQEVLHEGDDQQKAEAQTLLGKLG